MKVGDFVRSKMSGCYGLVTRIGIPNGAHVCVLWQGIACKTTWESVSDLVFGVENELVSFRGDK